MFKIQTHAFSDQGFLLLPQALDPALCEAFGEQVSGEFRRLVAAGWRFADAGRLSGHLNIRMGREGRALLDAFQAAGLENALRALSGEPVRLMQAVGNLNLPGSCAQDFHMDGSYDRPIFIANVCLVPTTRHNGATELAPMSNRREMSYWRFSKDGWRERIVAPELNPGDVLIRPSNLWHRGTPNRSSLPRPMAAFSYVPERFLAAEDCCTDLDGPLTLFGNKYYGRFRTAKEILAARLPLVDEALRRGKSFVTERNLGRITG